jgi:hypothetical protein
MVIRYYYDNDLIVILVNINKQQVEGDDDCKNYGIYKVHIGIIIIT